MNKLPVIASITLGLTAFAPTLYAQSTAELEQKVKQLEQEIQKIQEQLDTVKAQQISSQVSTDMQMEALEEKFIKENQPVKTTSRLSTGTGTQERDDVRGAITTRQGYRLKIGGYARFDSLTHDGNLNANRDVEPRNVLVKEGANYYLDRAVDPTTPSDTQTYLNANISRLNFEVLGDTDIGVLKVFMEGDFATDSFRLRHAFGEINGWTIGQTWNGLLNLGAIPDTVNFAGPHSAPPGRNPLIRYTANFGEGWRWSLSAERSDFDLSSTPGYLEQPASLERPDLITSLMYAGDWGNIFLAAAQGEVNLDIAGASYGDITLEPGEKTLSGEAYHLSGAFKLGSSTELMYGYTVTHGLTHYIRDLRSAGVAFKVDASGKVDTLESEGYYLSLTQSWSPKFKSVFVYSLVDVDDSFRPNFSPAQADQQAAFDRSINESKLGSANLIWYPTANISAGVELYRAERKNVNGFDGDSDGMLLYSQFNF